MAHDRRETCGIFPHPKCSSCGSIVIRRTSHTHTYWSDRPEPDTLCRDCFALTCAAATVILKGLESAGISMTSSEIIHAVKNGHIGCLVQVPLLTSV